MVLESDLTNYQVSVVVSGTCKGITTGRQVNISSGTCKSIITDLQVSTVVIGTCKRYYHGSAGQYRNGT